MNWRPVFLFLGFVGWAAALPAQDFNGRVRNSLDGLGSLDERINEGTMRGTVLPFETANPAEAGLSPLEFDAEEMRRQVGDTPDARAYGTLKDSATGRPKIDLGEDPLSLADDAVEQSGAVVGGLFSGAGGQCSQGFDGGDYSGTQFCNRILLRTTKYCREWREISVDREDDWQCHFETGSYKKECRRTVAYHCSGSTGAACRRQNVLFSPTANWNQAGTEADIWMPARSNGHCSVKVDAIYITVTDKVQLNELVGRMAHFNGVMQVKVDGNVVATTDGHGNVLTSLPAHASLRIADRDCGKRCTRRAVYAGNTWLEDCSSHRRVAHFDVNLRHLFPSVPLGPVRLNENALEPVQGPVFGNRIEILRANTHESSSLWRLHANGACCGQISTSLGAAC